MPWRSSGRFAGHSARSGWSGWRRHNEWRLKDQRRLCPIPRRPLVGRPQWNGEAIRGRLLLHVEDGHGDAFMLLRWIPRVLERVGSLRLRVCPEHMTFLRANGMGSSWSRGRMIRETMSAASSLSACPPCSVSNIPTTCAPRPICGPSSRLFDAQAQREAHPSILFNRTSMTGSARRWRSYLPAGRFLHLPRSRHEYRALDEVDQLRAPGSCPRPMQS
jgi:hypothetical protein